MAPGPSDWVPADVDIRRANVARVYDYWLGGDHNFLADQDVARAITAVEPKAAAFARANREFMGRAVRYLMAAGIRQFLDVGSGIPTAGNVHEIAQQADPDVRVAYVDVDPVAVAHSQALLAGNAHAAVIQADLREPEAILGHPRAQRLIDPAQPTGLLLVAVLHFLADAEDPWEKVAALRDALAPGSFVAIGHATVDGNPTIAKNFEKVYNRTVSTSVNVRPRAEILQFFDGFDLVDPGLTYIPQWRPDAPEEAASDPGDFWGELVGVGRKA